MQLTTLIVDDEPLARAGLRLLLAADADVASIDEAARGDEAVARIVDRRPDLVFLDVQMPEMDGFSVLERVGAARMPAVVFVTAHDRYAIQAFDINAIDYLLKPVTEERFAQALVRAKARLQSADEASAQIRALLETLSSPTPHVTRVAVRSAARIFFVEVDDVDWIQAAENYVELHVGRASHLLHVSMSALERALDPTSFLRIHRSLIVNVRRIRELEPAQHGEFVVTLKSGVRLQSSRTYHHKIKALLTNPF
jgi:two-component system, LytTR family, response regulator